MTRIAQVWSIRSYASLLELSTGSWAVHFQIAHREQRAGELEQLVALGVGGHPADRLQNRRIRFRHPQERHDSEIENRQGLNVDGRSARGRDAPRHAQRWIKRPVRVNLDHHLQPRQHHVRGNHSVSRCRQRSLVDIGRDRARLPGDVSDMRERAAQVKRGPDGRKALVVVTARRHEDAQQRLLATNERNRELPRLDGLDKICHGGFAFAEGDPLVRDALQPFEEPGVGGRAESRARRSGTSRGTRGSSGWPEGAPDMSAFVCNAKLSRLHQAAELRRHRARQLVLAKVHDTPGQPGRPARTGSRPVR